MLCDVIESGLNTGITASIFRNCGGRIWLAFAKLENHATQMYYWNWQTDNASRPMKNRKCKHGLVIGKKKLNPKDEKFLFIDMCRCCKNEFWHSGYITHRCVKCDPEK